MPEYIEIKDEQYQLCSVDNLGVALEKLIELEKWAEGNFREDELLVWDIDVHHLYLYLWFSRPTSATLYALSTEHR